LNATAKLMHTLFCVIAMLAKNTTIILVITCIIFTPYQVNAGSRKSALTVKPSVIDIGTQQTGQIVETKSTIFNTGTESITIKKFVQSCNCLDIQTNTQTIAPGKHIELNMKINGPIQEGKFEKSLWILTDDLSNPVYTIKIIGDFIALDHQLVAYPDIVICGSIDFDSKVSRAIQVKRNGGVPIGQVR